MMMILMFLISLGLIMLFLNKNLLIIFMQNLLFLLLFLMIIYNLNLNSYNYWMFIMMSFGIDKVSMILIMLLLWLISLMFMSILNLNKSFIKLIIIQFILLLISLIYYFYSLNLINFYLFFEFSLLPILMMILGWGVQPERLQAGVYMLMYTLFASLPFFILIILLNLNMYTLSLNILMIINLYLNNYFIYFFFIFLFMVKLPIYLVHLWLPKAHVEAPIFGSMILAGVLLKLGGYGIFRMFFIFMKLMMKFNLILMIFVFIGSLIISILCLRQIDLKMLIAYSSVVHMSLMLVGMVTMNLISMLGSILMMIGHGLCSSGLFCLLNMNYKRVNSRSLIFNKGMYMYFPNLSMWWFLFCIMNMAAPPSLNLISEILLILVILKWSLLLIFILFFLSLFSSIYSIYLFSYSQHGQNFYFNNIEMFILIDEYLLLILHWIPMNFLILNLIIF